MTKEEAKALVRTDPLPDEWNGKKKVYEYVYHSQECETKRHGRKKLIRERWKRTVNKGFYCPSGKHRGIYKSNGKWYAYQHYARYK